MKAVVERGISGSGKSTEAKSLAKRYLARVVSADDFFAQGGSYEFDSKLLGEAHQWCMKKWIELCQAQHQLIVCDNTNTSVAEFAPYVAVALAYGYNVEVVTFLLEPARAYQRNQHNVPLGRIEQMHERLMAETQLIPPWWRHTEIDYRLPEPPPAAEGPTTEEGP